MREENDFKKAIWSPSSILKMRFLKIALIFFIVLCLHSFSTKSIRAAEDDQKIVKVGFFAFNGYHVINQEDQMKSGYGYEVLQMMSRYNNWVYDYVGYDFTWNDMLTMLENGDIDLVTSATYSEDRAKKFAYSKLSIGTKASILTIKAGNNDIIAGEYSTYDGMKVGLLENNSANNAFKELSIEKGFEYEEVIKPSVEEITDALQKGEVDAIVTSNLRIVSNEWILEEFSSTPFHVIVRKENTELLNEVNNAIDKLDLNSSGWRTKLWNDYYTPKSADEIAYTIEERRYLENIKDKIVLKAIVCPDRSPYSYFEDGVAKGILVDMFEKMMSVTNIDYKIIETKNREEYNNLIDSGTIDIRIDAGFDYNEAELRNYKLTSSYFSSNISKIERKNSSENDNTVASLRQPDTTNHNKVLLEQYDLKLYDTLEECVRAVEKKEASCTYVYTYCAQEFDKEDFANRLKIYLVPNLNMDFALGISNNCDSSLMTILDKASQLITDNETQEIIDKYTSATVAQNILSFFYDYPFLIIGIFLFIAILACLIIIYYMRYKIARKSDRKNSQLARFMEYVCTAYDYVIDVNLVNRTGQKYYLEDEKVITKEMSFNDESIVYDLADLTFHPKYEKAFYEILTTEVVNSMIDGNKGDIYFEGLAKRDNEDYEWYSYTIQAIKKDASYPRNLAILIKNINTLRKEEMAQNQALSDAFELARSANEAKSSFMSRMSHEIRSPLNAIIGYITIAKTTTNDSHRLLDYIDKSEMAAKHLLSIINDILDISSIESGKMKIAYDDFNVKQLITSISSLFYAQAIQKDLEFTAVVKEISEEWVIGDQLRVSQILMNLLSNAIKFTPSNGQVSLIVTQKVLDNDRIHMIFEIKDTGIGMSDEFLQRIYSPFEQESASTSLKYGGTGLGLSITHNLVEMMNGTMDIESKLNEGTTFKVTLPLGHSALHENNPLIKHDFSDIRALVVDDCEDDREYIKEILTKFKIETDVCKDGPSAIKQLKRRFNTEYEYKLCLIDWKMEGMNGVETAEEIRKQISKEVPIIIVTSYDISEVRQDAKNIGVNMIVSKPLFPSTIFNMLINSYDYHIEIPKEIDYSSLENKRILLVEDNFMNREIAMKLLEQASIKVEIAVDGKEAVEKFAESSKEYYDAILMDIQMPNMNGYDATKAIRKLEHENAKDIPIIAMTADVFADDVAKAIAAGMNDHIAKPIDYQKMLNTIKKQFNKEEGTNKDE